ncbi:MAG: DUF1499 domain-containing protein [Acetobacteraceae bacterium]|nr:DUF1499 domain-containing protein [Acetobacteraceae bacterium]
MRRLLPLLLALLLPACRDHGADGIAPATVIDMTRLVRPATPNTALAAPEGFAPVPDIITPRYAADPDRLFAAIQAVALAQPRVFVHGTFPQLRQAHFVARSALLNFPDLIAVQVTPESGLVLWSRSVHGRSDFGVNRARLAAWLAALPAALAGP